MSDDRDALEQHLAGAAEFHVAALATWWGKLPAPARAGIAGYLGEILGAAGIVGKLLPADLNPLEVTPAATQLYGIVKGYTGGKAAVINAIKALLPELAPVAAALETL